MRLSSPLSPLLCSPPAQERVNSRPKRARFPYSPRSWTSQVAPLSCPVATGITNFAMLMRPDRPAHTWRWLPRALCAQKVLLARSDCRAPLPLYIGARSQRQSLPLGRARAPSRVLGRTIPGALDTCSPRSSRLRQWLVADDSTGRAISRHHALRRIDYSTLWEAHRYGCHFGASGRAIAVIASQGHTWVWRIVMFVIAGRMGGPCDLHCGTPFVPCFVCRDEGLSRAGVRLSVGGWWPAGYYRDRLTCA